MSRAEFEAAVKKCNAVLKTEPHNPTVLRRRGEAKRKLGLHQEAVSDFNAALAFQPAFALALAGRGAARRSLGQLAEALQDFDSALKLEPHNSLFLLDRGSARHAMGRTPEAVADADAALALRPDNVSALQLRGEARRKLGQLAEAISDFDAALRLDPRHVQALAGRGAAKRALGRRAEALADYDAALALAPRSPSVFAGRGAARLELRMADAAKADFEASLALDPRSEFARWGLDAAALQLQSAGLQITLAGFQGAALNAKYIERRRPGFIVNGLATFWTADGQYFLYWCEKNTRWKGSRWQDLSKAQKGGTSSIVAAPPKADIRSTAPLAKGWHEFDGRSWVGRKNAGVASIAALEVNVQTLTLTGFSHPELNARFSERFRPKFLVAGRETYWTSDFKNFLYFSVKESRWKGTVASDLQRVQSGGSPGFIGAPAGVDITAPVPVAGWHEWDGVDWHFQEGAGVAVVGTLSTVQNAGAKAGAGNVRPREEGAADAAPPNAKVARTAQKVAVQPKVVAQFKEVPKVPLFSEPKPGDDDEWT